MLVIDRYEVGERQTSACGVPTTWLDALQLRGSLRQTFGELVVHTPWKRQWRLPWTFSTFDYPELCALMWEQAHADGTRFETATVTEQRRATRCTPIAASCALRLIVDALGWRRTLSRGHPDPATQREAVAGTGGAPARAAARRWSCGSTPATYAQVMGGASRPR